MNYFVVNWYYQIMNGQKMHYFHVLMLDCQNFRMGLLDCVDGYPNLKNRWNQDYYSLVDVDVIHEFHLILFHFFFVFFLGANSKFNSISESVSLDGVIDLCLLLLLLLLFGDGILLCDIILGLLCVVIGSGDDT